jgi:hypothetical protein
MTIKVYSNDEKTDIMLIYGECNKNASVVRLNTDSSFLPNFIYHANDVYVKIYETAQLTLFYIS